jgi:hypothetical protein
MWIFIATVAIAVVTIALAKAIQRKDGPPKG